MSENKTNKMKIQSREIIRTIIFGFLIWFIPALVATLLWDVSKNQPAIDNIWYNAILGAVWSSNFAFVAYLYFKNLKDDYSKYGFITGIIWYIMSFLLDFLVVVIILNLGIESFLPGVVVYINNFVLAGMIGYLLMKKIQREQN
ncbi:MAG: hypothetical protein ACFFAO_15610 [Candidatus Hermodarchaeota archaeon]